MMQMTRPGSTHSSSVLRARTGETSRLRKFASTLNRNKLLILIALPAIVLIFALRYVPMFGIVIAFEDFQASTGFLSPWVGLRNFRLLFESPILWRLVRNTLLLNIVFITVTTFFAVGMALVLNEIGQPFFRKVAQSIMFLPFFMSWTVVAMIVYGFFDYESGMINVILRDLGMERLTFYDKPNWWPLILTVLRVWKGTGSGCVLYLAVLVGIDPQLYEAAQIDGASRLARIRHISLPLLTPTIILVTLLAIGHIFYGDFGMIYAIVGDSASLYPTTDVIDTYIIRALQGTVNFGMSTAVGLSQSVLGFICVFGSNWIVKKWSERRGEDYSLF
jgi:putative aldouronate transport system permease protein